MGKIQNDSELNQGWETFKTYKFVREKLIEKGYKQINVIQVDSYLTYTFEYWINFKNDTKEPNIVLVEVLKNNDAIVYFEKDINDLK
jgi:uncharacterized protein with gpF-like domain